MVCGRRIQPKPQHPGNRMIAKSATRRQTENICRQALTLVGDIRYRQRTATGPPFRRGGRREKVLVTTRFGRAEGHRSRPQTGDPKLSGEGFGSLIDAARRTVTTAKPKGPVILSEATASPSEAVAESKDPYPPNSPLRIRKFPLPRANEFSARVHLTKFVSGDC